MDITEQKVGEIRYTNTSGMRLIESMQFTIGDEVIAEYITTPDGGVLRTR